MESDNRGAVNFEDLSPRQQDETIAELAGHLDDLYGQYRARGKSESEAVAYALREVCDWQALSQTIQRAKREEGSMNTRTEHLLLPGFVTLSGAVLLFAACIRLNHSYIYHGRFADAIFDLPWLFTLPFCGAAGAYLSRRAGGSRMARLACSLFPAGVMLVSMACIILLTHIFGTDGAVSTPALPTIISTTILVPGAAALLGALPFSLSERWTPRTSSTRSGCPVRRVLCDGRGSSLAKTPSRCSAALLTLRLTFSRTSQISSFRM